MPARPRYFVKKRWSITYAGTVHRAMCCTCRRAGHLDLLVGGGSVCAGSIYVVCTIDEYATGLPSSGMKGALGDRHQRRYDYVITIQSGQYVEAAQVLLRLNDARKRLSWNACAGIARPANHRLNHPHDAVAQQQLATLRAQAEVLNNGSKSALCSASRWDRAATYAYVRSSWWRR